MTQINYYESYKLAVERKAEQAEVKRLAIESLRQLIKKVLGRGADKGLTNAYINEVLATYKDMGINNINDILDKLSTLKGAKSKEELIYNILNDLQAGTKSDRSVLDLTDIQF